METNLRVLVQNKDYAGISEILSQDSSLANEGLLVGDGNCAKAHPLHRICDAVFAKLITDEEAIEVAKILLEFGARIDGDLSEGNPDTPLIAAASLHAEKLGIFYIEKGARIDVADKNDGATALHWAAFCGRDKLVAELIRSGADVNQRDKTYNCTPLVWALQPLQNNDKPTMHNQAACIDLLLKAGTDISNIDESTKQFLATLGTQAPDDEGSKLVNPDLTINELVIYVPAEDFEVSRRFYAALGFEQTPAWDNTLDCRLGTVIFRLQNFYVKDWAENFMMKFFVNDIHAWYDHAKKVIDAGSYANARYDKPETMGETTVFHVWDPCGVLLVFLK